MTQPPVDLAATDRPSGVLMANLGSPAAPTAKALRPYLAQFLSDKRVIDYPAWKWKPILHGIVLRTRPKRSAKAYAEVWTENGAPLIVGTEALAKRTEALLREAGQDWPIVVGMRYGEPSIGSALRTLREAGIERILVLPLYPQYSQSTTASIFDAVFAELRKWRWVPELVTVNEYYREPRFIDAVAATIREYWDAHGEPERLLFSFHGVPIRYCQGDPYRPHCEATALRVAMALGLKRDRWIVSYQSRFGPEKWLEPETEATLKALGRESLGGRLDVVCPGFSIDCLETLEEIAMSGAEQYRDAGGGDFGYVTCLNDRADHAELMRELIQRYLCASGTP